ncbi:heme exporter protein CcmD [Thiospirillum jenense]|uniref:heme exporter protein CcmD n=1 Tax=Thiospirillum jenense TaxID=1653858 RepID=UPI00188936B9|nr:heme exporter protein CcmD [Thiospirillum jenense]
MATIITFFQQGGYAFFVWSAFGVTLGLLLLEVFFLRREQHATLRRLVRIMRMRAQAGGW